MRRSIKAAIAIGAIVCIVASGAPAFAAPSISAAVPSSKSQKFETTTLTLPLSHPVTLQDAIAFASRIGQPVEAYSFNNGDIEGEYSPSADQSASEFLSGFSERFGTQPEVTGLVTRVNIDQAQQRTFARTAPLDPGTTPFDAPPAVPAGDVAVAATPPVAVSAKADLSRAVAAAGDWRPNDAEGQVTNQNGRADFLTSYWWHSGSLPSQMPAGFGAEFQVDLVDTSRPNDTGLRPACAAGYKDNMWAKNYSWNWALYKPDYSAAGTSTLGAYADYNDLSDACNRNSIAIGMRYPQRIQAANGSYGIIVWVSAPRGTRTSSKMTGTVQAISENYCLTDAGKSKGLTDCMGVYQGSWPLSVPQYRHTVGASRNWSVPAKCWMSQGKGLEGSYFTELLPC
ncbi:hypothetical protein MT349_19320 [Rathayibacter caricis]|uniref:hypothetical protein n=1 Tax=Rathayibacter caricis TaxID=110936 RepID=UPI001FB4D7F4|nr:hypothetical protein [Rathayibacter caricis]MCJ1697938.1 hypothetical protein [Rathayibacter caricis]